MSAAIVGMAAAAVESEVAMWMHRAGRPDRARVAGGWAILLALVGFYAFVMRALFG